MLSVLCFDKHPIRPSHSQSCLKPFMGVVAEYVSRVTVCLGTIHQAWVVRIAACYSSPIVPRIRRNSKVLLGDTFLRSEPVGLPGKMNHHHPISLATPLRPILPDICLSIQPVWHKNSPSLRAKPLQLIRGDVKHLASNRFQSTFRDWSTRSIFKL